MTHKTRRSLNVDDLRASIGPPWIALDVIEETESTNADLAGTPAGTVLAAEYQRSGRGRLDRSWVSPPRAGLLFSAVVRADVPAAARGWLPLLTGVALCEAVTAVTGLAPVLKWPNDVLLGEQKVAGVLVQVSDDLAVIGVGLNVSTERAELPVDTATSLALAGALDPDRTQLLVAILGALGRRYSEWTAAAGDAAASGLAGEYRDRCATIGREVSVVGVAGERRAYAIGVEDDGRLRVRWEMPPPGSDIEQSLAAGDIVHLRVTGRPAR